MRSACWRAHNATPLRSASRAILLLRPWSRPGRAARAMGGGTAGSRSAAAGLGTDRGGALRRPAGAPEILAEPHVLARVRDRERTRGRLPRRLALSQHGLATSGARRFH